MPKGTVVEDGKNWRKRIEKNSFIDWKEGDNSFGST